MCVSDPFRWKLPYPSASWAPVIAVLKLSTGEILLLLGIIASVLLDIVANITAYFGVHSSSIAILKGLILVIVVGNFRTSYSYFITFGLFIVFLFRELCVVIGGLGFYPFDDAVLFLRILFFVTWLLLFYERRDRTTFLRCVLWIFVPTIVLSVICQIAGLGLNLNFFKAYGDQRGGYKGLFLAENDTSVLYLISLVYSMSIWKSGKRLYTVIILAGLILLAAGSKTASLGILIVPIVYFFFSHSFRSPIDLRRLAIRPGPAIRVASGGLVLGVIGYLGVRYISDILAGINYEQLLQVYEKSGLLSSLLSYRDVKALIYLHSVRSVPDVLFGLQAQVYTNFQHFGSETPGDFMYEIDLFDYLARVGLAGIVLTLAAIWKTANLRTWRSCTPELKTYVVTIFLLGCTVGHTLISSMNGIWIAFLLIILSHPVAYSRPSESRL